MEKTMVAESGIKCGAIDGDRIIYKDFSLPVDWLHAPRPYEKGKRDE